MHLWSSGGALLYFDALWIGHHRDLNRPPQTQNRKDKNAQKSNCEKAKVHSWRTQRSARISHHQKQN